MNATNHSNTIDNKNSISSMYGLSVSPSTKENQGSNVISLDSRRSITKERLLAYLLYVDDIDFVKEQRNYLHDAGAQDLSHVQTLLPENLNVSASILPGYTLLHQISNSLAASLIFAATHDVSGAACIVRLTPDISESDHIARFVNEWYITLGLNASKEPRLWSGLDLVDYDASSPIGTPTSSDSVWDTLEKKHSYLNWKTPRTLPKNIPGILYPTNVFNVTSQTDLTVKKRMAMVYPNHGYRSIRDIYHDNLKSLASKSDKSSLHSDGIKSVLSELTINSDTNGVEHIILGNNLGSGEFDDLSNRVRQIPKTREIICEILEDLIDVLDALKACHKLGFVHNGITSHHILRSLDFDADQKNSDQSRVVLTGFDFGFSVVCENSFHAFRKKNLRVIDDLLPYMSPENSGDANPLVNQLTDIYSFGIVLYEMIVGCLPFQSDNPTRIRKMHLSQKPISPIILGKNWITKDLNNIIMKCLEKTPEDRYISVACLQQDLVKVLLYYVGADSKFPAIHVDKKKTTSPEQSSETPRLDTLPVKLLSLSTRDQISQFLDQHQLSSKFVILKGGSGVGKTAILHDMAGQAISRYEFVIPWSYDCSDMNVTKYGSHLYGIHIITRQILSSSAENIAEWRQRLTNEIDTDLSVLFPTIPDLKILLGPHYSSVRQDKPSNNGPKNNPARLIIPLGNLLQDDTDLENWTPKDTQLNDFDEQALGLELKYKYIFKKFFGLVAQRKITVVLDDFQWCPRHDMELLAELVDYFRNEVWTYNMSIIASFHTGEAISSYENDRIELSELESVVSSLDLVYKEFEIKELNPDEFEEYLKSFLHTKNIIADSSTVGSLYELTQGNRLSFEYLSRFFKLKNHQQEIGWKTIAAFAKTKVKNFSLPQFLIDEIIEGYMYEVGFDSMTRLLKFAAIISVNGIFKMSDLMIVTGLSLAETHEILQICMETNLIVPSGIYYKMPFHLIANNSFPFELDDSIAWDWTAQARYRFDHNVIHFNLLKQLEQNGEFQEFHRLAGLRLKKNLAEEPRLNISEYLTMSLHILMSCDAAKEKDWEQCYDALVTGGRYAVAAANIPLALKFFSSSLNFIDKNDRHKRFKTLLTCIQCHYLLKDFEKCVTLISEAEEQFGKDNWILVHLKVRSLFNFRQFKRGMKKAIRALQALDIEVSLNQEQCKPIAEKLFSQLPLSVNEIRVLKTLKRATDPRFILVAELIMDIINPTYVLGLTDLRKLLLAKLVHMMLQFGYTNACGVPIIHLANIFVQKTELISIMKACEFADVALSFGNSDKGSSSEFSANINESYIVLMAPFKQPLVELTQFASMISLDNRLPIKPQESSLLLLTVNSILLLSYLTGWSSLWQALQISVELNTNIELLCYSAGKNLWMNHLTYEQYLEQYKLLKTDLTPDLEFCYLSVAVLWCATVGRFTDGAEIVLERANHVSKKLPMSLLHVRFHFFSAICLCFNEAESNRSKGIELAEKIAESFNLWAEFCYRNVGPELKIINICIKASSFTQPSLSILDLFEEAIVAANSEAKWLELALANHACALWLLKTSDNKKRAYSYANEAYSIYRMMNLDAQADRFKDQQHELFGSVNWAGIAKVPQTSRLRLGSTKAFSDDFIQTFLVQPDYSPMTEDSIEFPEPLVKDKPKLVHEGSNIQPTQDEWVRAIRLCLSILQSSDIDCIVLKLLESCLSFSGVDYGAVVLNLHTQQPMIKAIGTIHNMYKLDDELLISRADLAPYMLVMECFFKGECINKEDNPKSFEEKFGKDPYFSHNVCSSVLCIPIKTSTIIGALYLERHVRQQDFTMTKESIFDRKKIDLFELLCSQAAVSFSKLIVFNQMELAKKVAEEATEEKASFLANMSHEIRTPFNSLFACSTFLLDTKLTPSQREYVETIKNSSLVTLNIIDGILAFSKIEHGSFGLEDAPFSVNDSIESSISISSNQLDTKNIEFAYFNKCPEIDLIFGDATRVRQIVINLVGNALKFTNEGFVKVTLSAEHIRESRYNLCLSVEDTGIGIPDGSKSKIFGAFSQVDGSLKRVHGGLGLGLAISKKLAELMNGQITFVSQLGKGSTFKFSCPFEVQLNRIKPLIKPQTVCIVSQLELKRESLCEMIEYYGPKAISFRSLEDVVSSGQHYDVILVDRRCLRQGQKVRSTLKKEKIQIFLIVRFGPQISDTITNELEVDTLVFSPMTRSTMINILENKLLTEKEHVTGKVKPKEPVYPLNILIAEDNPINLRVASQHLKTIGYRADHAKDGVEVIQKCEELLSNGKKYDVILMDIQMPRKDGIEAAIELRESFAERNCSSFLPQIIALTANVAGEDRQKCLSCGMVDFVLKPILPDELKRVLANVAESIKNKERGL